MGVLSGYKIITKFSKKKNLFFLDFLNIFIVL